MTSSNAAIVYLRPCVTEAGKVSAETHLAPRGRGPVDSTSEFFDSARLCWALNGSQVFNRVKCSEKLGIAKVELNSKTVVVSKSGRINVRRADDEEDALRATRLVARATWPAMICSECGKTVVECVAGLCTRCSGRDCPLLLSGPPEPASISADAREAETIREILAKFAAGERSSLQEVKGYFDAVFQILKNVIEIPSSYSSSSDVGAFVAEKLEAGRLLAQRLIAEGQTQVERSAGLAIMGITVNLESLSQAAVLHVKLVQSCPDSFLAREAWRIVMGAYEALWQRDQVKVQGVAKLHAKVMSRLSRSRKCRESDLRRSLGKLVELGLSLSRIVSIRLAV